MPASSLDDFTHNDQTCVAMTAIGIALGLDAELDTRLLSGRSRRLIESLKNNSLSKIYLQCHDVPEDFIMSHHFEQLIEGHFTRSLIFNMEEQGITADQSAAALSAHSDIRSALCALVAKSIGDASETFPAIVARYLSQSAGSSFLFDEDLSDPSDQWESIEPFLGNMTEEECEVSDLVAHVLVQWKIFQGTITNPEGFSDEEQLSTCKSAWVTFRDMAVILAAELPPNRKMEASLSGLQKAFDQVDVSPNNDLEHHFNELTLASAPLKNEIEVIRVWMEGLDQSRLVETRFLHLVNQIRLEAQGERTA